MQPFAVSIIGSQRKMRLLSIGTVDFDDKRTMSAEAKTSELYLNSKVLGENDCPESGTRMGSKKITQNIRPLQFGCPPKSTDQSEALYKYESGKPRRRLSLRFGSPIVTVRYIENRETLKEMYKSSISHCPQYDGKDILKSNTQPSMKNGDREATSTPFSVVLDQSHKKEKENQKSQEQNRQSPRYNPYNNSGRYESKSWAHSDHCKNEDSRTLKHEVTEPIYEKEHDVSDTNKNIGMNRNITYEFSLIAPPKASIQLLENGTDQKSPVNSNPVIHLNNHGEAVCKTEAGGVLIELISRAKYPPAKNLLICLSVKTEFGYMKISPWINPFSDQDIYLGTEELIFKYSYQTRKYKITSRITPYFVIESHKQYAKSYLVQQKQHPNAFGVYSTKEVLLKTVRCEETWELDDAGEICSQH
ncbi:hypothetical protein CRE_15274 [Caenorhabditis remanei]|uniref:Uncharacterized protein n=1 Tax=Caenorhabditis remanei TaxID=31234 RepID=E3MBZ4_CAERE|nr:hypothetical protein CRE_15274 [Caenorhabditis remanei]